MAFLLAIGICLVWSVLGWSILEWSGGRRNVFQSMLLAPAVGASALVVTIFEMHRAGMPVRYGGPVATAIALAVVASWRLAGRGSLPPRRAIIGLFTVLIGAALFTGAPLVVEGFEWISYCNDDMANYVLSARGLLQRGHLGPYDPAAIIANRDMALQTAIDVELAGARCGAELLMAWVMALTGMGDHRVFMPTIVAMHLALLCATAGLVCTGRRFRRPALAVLLWLSIAALPVLGVTYQLIAQVLGLALLSAACALLLRRESPRRRMLVVCTIVVAALTISYPELLAFLATAVLAYYGRHLLKSLRWLLAVSILAVLICHRFFIEILGFVLGQAQSGTASASTGLFPYYMVPTGLPTFWGLMAIGNPWSHPWSDLMVLIGAVLTAAGLYCVVRQYLAGTPVGALAAVITVVSGFLFIRGADFGLYKIAMYSWPALAGTVVLTAWPYRRSSPWVRRAAAVVVILGAVTAWRYVATSAEWRGSLAGFNEIPRATSAGLIGKMRMLAEKRHEPVVVVDGNQIVLAKIAGPYFAGDSVRMPARNLFFERMFKWNRWGEVAVGERDRQTIKATKEVLSRREQRFTRETVRLTDGGSNDFILEQRTEGPFTLLRTGKSLNVLNRSAEAGTPDMVSLVNGTGIRNHLLQVESELGYNYYVAGKPRFEGKIALFQLEPDYFRPGETMAAAGRHLLLETLGATTTAAVRLEVTNTLGGDGENRLPPAMVTGAGRGKFGLVGRGSARVVAPAVAPLTIKGRQFLAIDMGAEPRGFLEQRHGLDLLYGRRVSLDSRRITCFVRDISLVDSRAQAPRMLKPFATALRYPALLYSGSYEDGWVAEESFFELRQELGQQELFVELLVPDRAGRSRTMNVSVDGILIEPVALEPGEQSVRVALPPVETARVRRIALQFDRAKALSGADPRPASALISTLGIVRANENP